MGSAGSSLVTALLGAGRGLRILIRILTPGPQGGQAVASFSAVWREQDASMVDAVAGGEFFDDRIRLRE